MVWPNQFKLNWFETGLSASINGLYIHCVWLGGYWKMFCRWSETTPPKGSVFIPHAQAGNFSCLHYSVALSNQNMEVCEISWESLGDYITCGTCDVMSGRHTGAWCLMKNFICSMFSRQYQYCLLFNTNKVCANMNVEVSFLMWAKG